MYQHYKEGWLEVISGCMFAGKTEELIRRIKTLEYGKKKIKVFKPSIDNRYSLSQIASHSGYKVTCHTIETASDILKHLEDDDQVIAVDEVQFLDNSIIEIAEALADKGKRVILAGLDRNFRGEVFGPMAELMIRAEFVTKLAAVCVVCGAPATRTQRIIEGTPASYNDPTVLVGATDSYEPRCRHCHVVLNKPRKINIK
ncbi:MAG: thymidine kinase [Bacillales bacterium]|jgi:thymidine kinase|nr:thymidine kinase [Bacillales bacterium]